MKAEITILMGDKKRRLKVGDCFWGGGFTKYKYRIVAILEKENQIVFKYYGKYKQWWHYDTRSFHAFELALQHGYYYIKNKEGR